LVGCSDDDKFLTPLFAVIGLRCPFVNTDDLILITPFLGGSCQEAGNLRVLVLGDRGLLAGRGCGDGSGEDSISMTGVLSVVR